MAYSSLRLGVCGFNFIKFLFDTSRLPTALTHKYYTIKKTKSQVKNPFFLKILFPKNPFKNIPSQLSFYE